MGCRYFRRVRGGYICNLSLTGVKPENCCGCRSFRAPPPKREGLHISQHPCAVKGDPQPEAIAFCAEIGRQIKWTKWES